MLKKLFIFFIVLGTAALISGYVFYQKYQDFLQQPVFQKESQIEVKKGTTYRNLVSQTINAGGAGGDWQWRLLAKMKPELTKIKAGEYLIEASLKPEDFLQKIINNKILTYNFTIVEGMNWRELKQKLTQEGKLNHVLLDMTNESIINKLQITEPSLEGVFLPETYQYKKGDSDLDLLRRANKSLQRELKLVWENRAKGLPIKSSYELLTLASIVEKETAEPNERDEISGVFVRRLQKNMRLQTDPTVIYGIGESYDGDIKTKDLKTDTPYNTYTRFGLPPTPIAMPSLDSIKASAHPKDGKSLYFVANNRGGHYFSETYEEHKKAVKDYLKGKKL